MSVRYALLGLLAQRPRHGYELHAAFEAVMGGEQNWEVSDEWGRAVVMVTHDPRIAACADRIVFLKDGRVTDETVLDPQKAGNAERIRDRVEAMV